MSCAHSRMSHIEFHKIHKIQNELHILKEATFPSFYMGAESECLKIFGGQQKEYYLRQIMGDKNTMSYLSKGVLEPSLRT